MMAREALEILDSDKKCDPQDLEDASIELPSRADLVHRLARVEEAITALRATRAKKDETSAHSTPDVRLVSS